MYLVGHPVIDRSAARDEAYEVRFAQMSQWAKLASVTEHLDNPAGRLAAILSTAMGTRAEEKAWSAWSSALNADEPGTAFIRIGQLVRLIQETKDAIQGLPAEEDPAFYLKPFEYLDALATKLRMHIGHGDMKTFHEVIPEHVLVGVGAAARVLRRYGQTPVIEEADRAELLDQVRTIIDDVSNHPDLPKHAKLFMLKLLRDVEGALIAFRLGGFDDVAATVAALAGGVVYVENVDQRGWWGRHVSRLWEAVLARAKGVQAIAESVTSVSEAVEAVRHVAS